MNTGSLRSAPYNLAIVAAMILLLMSFFISDKIIDIHLHDTYIIIKLHHLLWFQTVVLVIIWILYKLTNVFLYSNLFSWIHIMVTIISFMIMVIVPLKYLGNSNLSMYDYSDIKNYQSETGILGAALIILIFGQLLYLINLTFGLIARAKNNRLQRM